MAAATAFRALIRRIIPFRIRQELIILRRLPRWLAERGSMARRRVPEAAGEEFGWLLASHRSPLERTPGSLPADLQQGKETNVRLAAEILDKTLIEPNQVFSHHHAIGRTSRRRGFRKGLELRNGESRGSWGGGLCQVSNSFYWVAVNAGMRITERHRHGLDLFPDAERTVPFGCGATVVYNYSDFRFENPLLQPVLMRARVQDRVFVSELWTTTDPGIRIEVEETGHRFYREDGGWMRENRLRRRIRDAAGTLLTDHEVAHNLGRVQYEPTPEQLA